MCRILLVDDYFDLLETTALLFETLGHDTRAVDNGHAAVRVAAGFDPDIVFLDLMMPEMDGIEAARAIRLGPNGQRPFIVALTASSTDGIEQLVHSAGFDLYMRKPVSTHALIALVDDLSRRRRSSPEPVQAPA